MAKKPRWTTQPVADGIWSVELFSWKYFHDFIRQKMLPFSHYVWRGQRDSSWKLQTSLDRALRGKVHADRPALVADHLERFKFASRGRRKHLAAAGVHDDNDWWALGQHNGLATPLLDWTESPFVALYFAFARASRSSTGFRSVWALGNVDHKNEQIVRAHQADDPPVLEYIRPFQDDNSRLVNQCAMFTRVPLGTTVCDWVAANYQGNRVEAALIHISIPETDRLDCLRTLNKMNINHKTLFPDLFGAAEHCNQCLAIRNY